MPDYSPGMERPILDLAGFDLGAIRVRPARDADSADAAELIARIWADYPNCRFDPDEERDLAAVETTYSAKGGAFWVARGADGRLVGTVAIAPTPHATGIVLHRLYVDRTARRVRLGSTLLALAESQARVRKAGFMEFWSDTRFHEAHAFYARHGYVQLDGERALRDASDSYEFHFRKLLGP